MMTRWALATALATLTGCAAATSAPPTDARTAPADAGRHENLNAVAWMQTAVEYEATALQAFRLAQLQLDAALAATAWTAALEQTRTAAALPPAVIVDVDETVLDNSYYQARLVRDRAEFAPATWDKWVSEARATAIPGALAFSRYATDRGITIFYITNRTSNLEEATRTNLLTLGFPVAAEVDTVLTRGERPEWQASNKASRRAHVAERYRVLLLVGDDLGDFVADATGSVSDRQRNAAGQSDWWGRRWIMLPNPSYGSWERALAGSGGDAVAAKRAALRVQPK